MHEAGANIEGVMDPLQPGIEARLCPAAHPASGISGPHPELETPPPASGQANLKRSLTAKRRNVTANNIRSQ
jgi:hypothetical protein